jgi:predicted GNAT superfamily acetyltransferase
MYSVVNGVAPGYQNRQIGWRLKLAQRKEALRLGIRLVTWTYDPLESRNAWLNIGKLGAICHEYLPDFYGEMTGINAGLASDRFYVEWWVTSNRAKGRVKQQRKPLQYDALIGGGAVLVNEATINDDGVLIPPANPILDRDSNLLLVEIPADIQTIKQENIPLAQAWRAHTATIFTRLFATDYIVTDFARRIDDHGRARSYYVLTFQHS